MFVAVGAPLVNNLHYKVNQFSSLSNMELRLGAPQLIPAYKDTVMICSILL